MTKEQKIMLAAQMTQNGIGPDQLRQMIKIMNGISEAFKLVYEENLKVLDEFFPDTETE